MEISKQIEHEIRHSQTQQVIINGQVISTSHSYSVFVCPNCRRVLFQLEAEIPLDKMSEVMRSLSEDFRAINYCPGCGQKIRYDVYDIIDINVEEVKGDK